MMTYTKILTNTGLEGVLRKFENSIIAFTDARIGKCCLDLSHSHLSQKYGIISCPLM